MIYRDNGSRAWYAKSDPNQCGALMACCATTEFMSLFGCIIRVQKFLQRDRMDVVVVENVHRRERVVVMVQRSRYRPTRFSICHKRCTLCSLKVMTSCFNEQQNI